MKKAYPTFITETENCGKRCVKILAFLTAVLYVHKNYARVKSVGSVILI